MIEKLVIYCLSSLLITCAPVLKSSKHYESLGPEFCDGVSEKVIDIHQKGYTILRLGYNYISYLTRENRIVTFYCFQNGESASDTVSYDKVFK